MRKRLAHSLGFYGLYLGTDETLLLSLSFSSGQVTTSHFCLQEFTPAIGPIVDNSRIGETKVIQEYAYVGTYRDYQEFVRSTSHPDSLPAALAPIVERFRVTCE